MDTSSTIWVFTLALALSAAWADWRTHRIPNWLTVPGLIVGIAVRTTIGGWPGSKASLEGASLALGLILPLVLLRALGAGDWKFVGAVGAFLGPKLLLVVLLVSFFVAGLMGVVQMMRAHRVVATLKNMWALTKGFFTFGLRVHPEISLDNPGLLKLPFGVAVAMAVLICYLAGRPYL